MLPVPRCAKGLGTLLLAYTNDNSSKMGCATCATSFFLSLKKKFALEFHYTLAQLPLHILDKIKACRICAMFYYLFDTRSL